MFKVGKFFSIQAKTVDGQVVYLEANPDSHSDKLRKIARKAASGRFGSGPSWEDDDDDYSVRRSVNSSENPFDLKLFPEDTKIELMVSHMRHIRTYGVALCDPTTIKLVVVETQVAGFAPEPESAAEIELRKFALEKLSEEEKAMLKLTHWDVYHKLSDRSMFDDDEES